MKNRSMVKKSIMLNLENLDVLYKLTATEYKILFELLKKYKAGEENLILINKHKRYRLSCDIDVSETTIKNACTKFVKTNILIRIATGAYKINQDVLQVVRIKRM